MSSNTRARPKSGSAFIGRTIHCGSLWRTTAADSRRLRRRATAMAWPTCATASRKLAAVSRRTASPGPARPAASGCRFNHPYPPKPEVAIDDSLLLIVLVLVLVLVLV